MVARCHHNIGFGVLFLDSPTHVCYAWSGVAAAWFAKDMFCRNLRQLLVNDVRIFGIGYHPDVVWVADAFKTVNGELQQRAAYTQHVDKLFGPFCCAHGPEAAADAACHDDKVVSVVCHIFYGLVGVFSVV